MELFCQYLNSDRITQILGIPMGADEAGHACRYESLDTSLVNDVRCFTLFVWDDSASQRFARDKAGYKSAESLGVGEQSYYTGSHIKPGYWMFYFGFLRSSVYVSGNCVGPIGEADPKPKAQAMGDAIARLI